MIGTQILHYRIEAKLGEGGMGEVFLATDTKLDRKVALKFLPPYLTQDPEFRSRFEHEAKAAAALNHPNIVTVYELNEHEGRLFIAMEHVEGESLEAIIERGDVPLDRSLQLVQQICEGLHEAHEAGIVHRDIKPANILIDSKGRARILDFGLAKSRKATTQTKTGTTLGTLQYESPEQVSGQQVDARSDLFSVGAVLYELITGRTPFAGEFEDAIRYAILNDEPEPLARYKSGASQQLQHITSKALDKNPETRYQTAADMLADLKRLQSDRSSPARPRRFPARLTVGLVLLFAVIAVVYFAFVTPEERQSVKSKRVAVLPLANLGDQDQAYFAYGMTVEITSRLDHVAGLAVVSRQSADRYRESDKTMKEIGSELDADYILAGSIRWQDSPAEDRRLRFVVHLIRVDEDVSVWSNTYDTVMTEVFSVQSEIAERIADELGIRLTGAEEQKISERVTESQEAYDFYLRGIRYHPLHGAFGPLRDFQLAAEMFHQAIALDSTFAHAYARLSLALSMQWERGHQTDSIKDGALRMAQRAIAIDPNLKLGGIALARYYFHCLHDPGAALRQVTETYGEDSTNPEYLGQCQIFTRALGDWEEAYRLKQRLIEIEPKNIYEVYDQGQNCIYLRRYEEAEELFDRVIRKQPDFFDAYERKADLYLNWMGDIHKIRAVIEGSHGKVDATSWRSYAWWLDWMSGDYQAALSQATVPPWDSLSYVFYHGLMYYRMDESDSMRVYLESARSRAEEVVKERPDEAWIHSWLGIIKAGLGLNSDAILEGAKALEINARTVDHWSEGIYMDWLLQIYIMVNEQEKALQTLERLVSGPYEFGLPRVFVLHDYAPLLDYPGFERLVQEHGNTYAKALWGKHQESKSSSS